MNNSALFKISYGLYVLTAADGGKDNGCIINTLMQVSSNPMTAVIAVSKQNYTHDMIMKTREFNASMLSVKADFEIFRRFGFQSGKAAEKFEGLSTAKRADNGIMYITETANAYATFKVTATADCGTHTLFTAKITDAQVLSDDESVTYSYYQSHIKPQKQTEKKKSGWICTVCGYIYEGENLPTDFICPLCKHGAADFERIKD